MKTKVHAYKSKRKCVVCVLVCGTVVLHFAVEASIELLKEHQPEEALFENVPGI